jgi:hypothetical protein
LSFSTLAAIIAAATTAARQASSGNPASPNRASNPSSNTWLGEPPAAATALLTALRNWLITKTVSDGSRPLASLVDPGMSTNMTTR